MVKISIILCTYSRIYSLKEAVRSVQNQNFTEYELIIIDDYSVDNTWDYLKKISEDDRRIIIHRNAKNLGLQKSLNIGLRMAKGEFIARIDDDDLWIDKFKLEKQLSHLELNPEIILVGTSYNAENQVINNPFSDKDIRKQILFRCPFTHSTVLFRSKYGSNKFIYDEELVYSEDWKLWLFMGRFGLFANLPDVTTKISVVNNKSSAYLLQQLPINKNLIKEYGDLYPRSWRAKLYHFGLFYFFKFFDENGNIHNLAKRVFKFAFLK